MDRLAHELLRTRSRERSRNARSWKVVSEFALVEGGAQFAKRRPRLAPSYDRTTSSAVRDRARLTPLAGLNHAISRSSLFIGHFQTLDRRAAQMPAQALAEWRAPSRAFLPVSDRSSRGQRRPAC